MKQQVELLSPAGNYEKAVIAINNGADALYLAYEEFGARAFADNFNQERLISIIQYAHLRNVKVYVTFNTLVMADELEHAKEVIDILYQSGVDALIVQDLGMIHYLRKTYPDLECHASTQMHLYNRDSLWFLHELGVTRAVLARECSIDQIKSFKDIPIEKEVFIHGSLCISYSGQCLISSLNFQRSGNKGKCAQSCRMKYDLINQNNEIIKEGYLLSPKDMMNISNIKDLLSAGIDSFKIEGRMKSNEYVGMVTRLYRNAIDKRSGNITNADFKKLKTIYNREYTQGHLYHQKGDKLINHYRPNHLGVPIGQVVWIGQDQFKVKLSDDLYQHDGIRIIQDSFDDIGFTVNKMYQNGKLINHASKGEEVFFDKRGKIQKDAQVVKTTSNQLIKEETLINCNDKKIPLKLNISLYADQPVIIEAIVDNEYFYYQSSTIAETALKKAIDDQNIQKAFSKLNDTCYYLEAIEINNDQNSFLAVSQLNAIRREFIDELNIQRLAKWSRKMVNYQRVISNYKSNDNERMIVSVQNEDQYQACSQFEQIEIATSNQELAEKYQLMRISDNVYTDSYDQIDIVSDLGGIKEGKILDYHLNICNDETLNFLDTCGIEAAVLSVELSDEQIRELSINQHRFSIGCYIYGKPQVMSMKYCPINHCVLNNDKQNCSLCKTQAYYLKDMKNRTFYMRGDDNCTMHLYNDFTINRLDNLNQYRQMGIKLFRVELSDESYDETIDIIKRAL